MFYTMKKLYKNIQHIYYTILKLEKSFRFSQHNLYNYKVMIRYMFMTVIYKIK